MNYKYLTVWFTILIMILCSCGQSGTSIPVKKASLKARYLSESDSVYVSSAADMKVIDGRLFLTEFQRGRLLIFDEQFNLDTIIGRYGKGPDEFYNAASIGVINQGFYVHDVFHGQLRVYNNSLEAQGNIKLHYPDQASNFALKDSVLSYAATDGQGYPIVTINLKGGEINRYGEFLEEGKDVFQKVNRSRGYVFSEGDNYLFIHSTEPLVKIYDRDFNILFQQSFADLELLNHSLRRAELTYENEKNTTLLLFEDIFRFEDRFYLATYVDSRTDDIKTNYGFKRKLNSIIEMEFDPQKLSVELKGIIDLSDGGGWYKQIIVESDRILAFDAINDELHEFELD